MNKSAQQLLNIARENPVTNIDSRARNKIYLCRLEACLDLGAFTPRIEERIKFICSEVNENFILTRLEGRKGGRGRV